MNSKNFNFNSKPINTTNSNNESIKLYEYLLSPIAKMLSSNKNDSKVSSFGRRDSMIRISSFSIPEEYSSQMELGSEDNRSSCSSGSGGSVVEEELEDHCFHHHSPSSINNNNNNIGGICGENKNAVVDLQGENDRQLPTLMAVDDDEGDDGVMVDGDDDEDEDRGLIMKISAAAVAVPPPAPTPAVVMNPESSKQPTFKRPASPPPVAGGKLAAVGASNGNKRSSGTAPTPASVGGRRRRQNTFTASTFHDLYKLSGDILGRGASASVRTCFNINTGQEYAVKIVEKRCGFNRGRVIKEIETFHLCSKHPNIVQLIEYFEEDDKFFMVFEKMNGGPLLNHIQRRIHFTEHEASLVLKDIVTALKFLHDKGIAHRDVKPENILCTYPDKVCPVKLCDLDLASKKHALPTMPSHQHAQQHPFGRSFGTNHSITTPELQSPVGSAEFMAPEVVDAFVGESLRYDKRCDMWSVGVILYIMLCGYPPFYGECWRDNCGWDQGLPCHDCQESLFHRIQKGEYDFPAEDWDCVSKNAKNLIQHLLVKDVRYRYSAEDVLNHPFILEDSPMTPLQTPDVLLRNDSARNLLQMNECFNALSRTGDSSSSVASPTSPTVIIGGAADNNNNNNNMPSVFSPLTPTAPQLVVATPTPPPSSTTTTPPATPPSPSRQPAASLSPPQPSTTTTSLLLQQHVGRRHSGVVMMTKEMMAQQQSPSAAAVGPSSSVTKRRQQEYPPKKLSLVMPPSSTCVLNSSDHGRMQLHQNHSFIVNENNRAAANVSENRTSSPSLPWINNRNNNNNNIINRLSMEQQQHIRRYHAVGRGSASSTANAQQPQMTGSTQMTPPTDDNDSGDADYDNTKKQNHLWSHRHRPSLSSSPSSSSTSNAVPIGGGFRSMVRNRSCNEQAVAAEIGLMNNLRITGAAAADHHHRRSSEKLLVGAN